VRPLFRQRLNFLKVRRARTVNVASRRDTANYSTAGDQVVVNLSNHKASGISINNDLLIEVENVIGGPANDILIGDQGANVLSGGSGNDRLGEGEMSEPT